MGPCGGFFFSVLGAAGNLGTVRPIVQVTYFRARPLKEGTYNGRNLSRIQELHSVASIDLGKGKELPGTCVSLVERAESPALLTMTFVAPPFPQCISRYLPHRNLLVTPFKVTLKGMIANVQPITMSLQGKAKVIFELVEDTGSWLP